MCECNYLVICGDFLFLICKFWIYIYMHAWYYCTHGCLRVVYFCYTSFSITMICVLYMYVLYNRLCYFVSKAIFFFVSIYIYILSSLKVYYFGKLILIISFTIFCMHGNSWLTWSLFSFFFHRTNVILYFDKERDQWRFFS